MTRTTAHHTSRPILRHFLLHAVMVASAVTALLPSRPTHADALANIRGTGVICVTIPNNFPPFGSLGPDLKLRGYDIDMAGLIIKELGVKTELVPVISTSHTPFPTTDKVDIVVSSLDKDAEHAKVIDFTQAYAPFPKGVYGPEDVSIEGPADLADKTVGVTRGSTEDLALSTVALASAIIKCYENNSATAQSYLIDQVQLVTASNIVANAVNERMKLRQLDLKFPVEDTPCYVGVAKGEPALLDKINTVITKLKTDDRLNDLSQHWIKMPLPAKP